MNIFQDVFARFCRDLRAICGQNLFCVMSSNRGGDQNAVVFGGRFEKLCADVAEQCSEKNGLLSVLHRMKPNFRWRILWDGKVSEISKICWKRIGKRLFRKKPSLLAKRWMQI